VCMCEGRSIYLRFRLIGRLVHQLPFVLDLIDVESSPV
jgi:hypothetical protein